VLCYVPRVMSEGKRSPNLQDWEELARAELKGKSPDDLAWHTPEGIAVRPLHTRADVEGLDFVDTLPGVHAPAVDDSAIRRLFDG
jgi:hypothetical protein